MGRRYDWLVGITGIITIGVLSWFLYREVMPTDQTGLIPVGTVTYRYRVAQTRSASSLIWNNTSQNEIVYDRQWVRTDNRSEATIHLEGETRIELDQNSMVVLQKLENRMELELREGRIRLESKGKVPISVRNHKHSVQVSGGSVRLEAVGKDRIQITSIGGSSQVASQSGESVKIETSDTILSGPDEPARLVQSGQTLLEPEDGYKHYLNLEDRTAPIRFAWDNREDRGTPPARFQLGDAPGFTVPLKDVPTPTSPLDLDLTEGVYYWRLVDRAGNPGPERTLILRKPFRIQTISPAGDASIQPGNGETPVSFVWSSIENQSSYILEISRDPGFSQMVTGKIVRENRITLYLEEGTYFWRVRPRLNQTRDVATSSPSTFTIEKRKPGLYGIFPVDRMEVSAGVMETTGVVFRWSGVNPGDAPYSFKIQNQKGETVYSSKITQPYTSVTQKLEKGPYVWEVSLLDDGTPTTARENFQVVEKRLLTPPPVKIRPVPTPIPVRRPVPIKQKPPVEPAPQEKKEEEVQPVPTQPEDYLLGLAEEKPKKPETVILRVPARGGIVDMSNSETLRFTWNQSVGADTYRFTLYHNGKTVTELETNKTVYVLTDLGLLDIGRFDWKVVPVNKANGLEGEGSTSYFSITLNDEPGQVQDLKTE